MLKIREIQLIPHQWPNFVKINVGQNSRILGCWGNGYDCWVSVLESTEDAKTDKQLTCMRSGRGEIPQNGNYIGNFKDGNGYFYHVIEVLDTAGGVEKK